MDDGSPTLEVGFAIDTAGSFESLTQLDGLIDKATANAVAEFAKVEKASSGMLNLAGATASIKAFGSAATRADQDIIRSRAQVESSGEALIRQIQRQTDAFGKTRSEIRGMKADAAALAAEQQGLTELAQRIRAAEASLYDQEFAAARKAAQEAEAVVEAKAMAAAAAENEAAAMQAEAAAAAKLSAEHAKLAAMVQESHDAQMADAAAAERLRETTDPLYAATKRLNAEIAESTRLYYAGATSEAEYQRQQQVLTQALNAATAQHNAMAMAGRKNAFAMQQVAIQIPDVVQGILSGQKPFQIFIQQGGQIAQIAMMAEGGIKGLALEFGALALAAAPAIAVLGTVAAVGFAAFKQFQSQVKDSGDLTRYRDSLGLTHKEMLQLSDGTDQAGGKIKELTDVTVTAGDVMAGLWKTIADGANVNGAWDSIKDGAVSVFGVIIEAWNATSAGITAGIYGTANAAKVIWNNFATSVGDAFYQAVNFAIDAMNKLAQAGTAVLNGIIDAANKVPGVNIGHADPMQIKPVDNPYKGMAGQDAANAAAKAISDGYTQAYADAKKADAAFWKQVGDNAKQSAKDRMKAEADAIKANRTPKKANDHGLASALDQLDAQIKGQWALAAAYQVSDAAAMKAEALQKAEEQAIRHKGETGIFYEKELAVAVAQTAVAGAKTIADLNAQTIAQRQVNDAVAAGVLPASQIGQAMQEANEKRQLLAALAVAEEKGWTDQAAKLRGELASLGKTQADSNAEAERAQVLAATASGSDQLDQLKLEASLIGKTNEVRAVAIAQLQAEQFLRDHPGATAEEAQRYIAQQVQITKQSAANEAAAAQFNEQLRLTADLADSVGDSLSKAFGKAGDALGDVVKILGHYGDEQQKITDLVNNQQITSAAGAKKSADLQMSSLIGITDAAKNLFSEHSKGYKAMEAAERALTVVQLARTAVDVAGGAARMFAELGVWAFPAVAAMIGVMASLGFGGGGKSADYKVPDNTGAGTVLGDPSAQSASIKNAIDALKEVDTLTNTYAREMSASLKSIDSAIGGLATVLVRAGDINASSGVTEGFKSNIIGSVLGSIPVIGGLLGSLFGSKTTVVGSGLYGGAQSIGSILSGGFDAQTYSDIQKKHKFFGITTGTSYKTQYGAADPTLENQFTLILKQFDDAIVAAAGPLGAATSDIQNRLNSFVVNIGKIDLKGLTGQQIQDKLEAVFGAAADSMADAAFPGIEKFQQVGEGAFETLVRVASTVEAVTNALSELGTSAQSLGIDAKMGLASQFDSVSDMTSAIDAYFQAFYSTEEQTAAKTNELKRVFDSLGLTMPTTLDAFRQLVDAQDLTTTAGQETYATLIKLAPAFADLQEALNGAKSAADIASERQDLQKQLLELQGDTAALRALQLAAIDPSNRALQEQIWAIQDAQDAAKAAQDLADAWTSVGDSIMDEVKRIRGLNDSASGGSFASLMGQFNAATAAARGGDQDAAKSLPQLSQDLLNAASLVATSRQELDRIQAQTAASLEATYAAIMAAQGGTAAATASGIASSPAVVSIDTLTTSQPATAPAPANDDIIAELQALRSEVAQLRSDNNSGHAATAGNTGAIKKTLDNVTAASGGDAISTQAAA